jgi:hypothetical protein
MSYLSNYLDEIGRRGNIQLAKAVENTVNAIVPQYIRNFSFREHVLSMLLGAVQAGKTSHMFGIMSAAADEGFGIFILLTTDITLLHQQTLKRAEKDLKDFCICDENDYLKFSMNNMKKPSLIILKKNGRVLKQWKNNFSSTNFCLGNPLFVVDDEADAISLNTLVNKNEKSEINKYLEGIRKHTGSSIYMQVTGTPQAIFLQTYLSGWNPYFIHYFEPGMGYLGGDFFFGTIKCPNVILTDDDEVEDILLDDEFPENGLKSALLTHLVTSAHILLTGGKVSNFLVHPSVKTEQHEKFAEKIGDYLNEISITSEELETIEAIESAYNGLALHKTEMVSFADALGFIQRMLEDDKIKIFVINSASLFGQMTEFEEGINIVVGGNSLGRGVTFPKLQTVYYCRVAKSPQADTMWQHSRMFGYDRDKELMRVYMAPILYKMFVDINTTNNSIIAQLCNNKADTRTKLYYAKGLRPTRNTVLDKKALFLLGGGVNYFPFCPNNRNIDVLDELLASFEDGLYSISLNFMNRILEEMLPSKDDFDVSVFISFLRAFISERPLCQGQLIVRRNRDIAKGTGTLLSSNDRELGAKYTKQVVLTMYKVNGKKGWDDQKLWIPNIKLPSDMVYYNVSSGEV